MKKSISVFLSTPERVQSFVETLSDLDGDFDLVYGSYILDARSLMGIFSLDLSKPIRLDIHEATEKKIDALRRFESAVMPGSTDGRIRDGQ